MCCEIQAFFILEMRVDDQVTVTEVTCAFPRVIENYFYHTLSFLSSDLDDAMDKSIDAFYYFDIFVVG